MCILPSFPNSKTILWYPNNDIDFDAITWSYSDSPRYICTQVCVGEGNGSPLQCSCLENSVDGGAWWAAVHRVSQSQTRRGNLACMHALEKEMATHSSVLAWRILGTEQPGGLPSMRSQGVRHDWSDLAAAATSMCVFIPQGLYFNFVATAHGMQDLKVPDQGSNQCPRQWNSES